MSYFTYTISFHQHSLTAHAHEYTPNTGRQPVSAAHRSALPDSTPRLELRDTTGPTLHAMAAGRCLAIPGFTCARKSMLLGPQARALPPDCASAHACAAAAMRCASRRRRRPRRPRCPAARSEAADAPRHRYPCLRRKLAPHPRRNGRSKPRRSAVMDRPVTRADRRLRRPRRSSRPWLLM